MNDVKNLINYLGQLKVNVNSDFMSEPIEEVIEQLERFEEFKKEIVWCEVDTKYGHPVYNRATIGFLYEKKYLPTTKKTITIEIEGNNGRELFCQFIKGKDLIEKHFRDERRRGRQGIFSNFDVCREKVQVIIKDKEGD